ncbi:MAG: hypothetical protein QME70_06365 [Bacillota bacterium]|nr:hypothetical protein [Bacillota bacterium]
MEVRTVRVPVRLLLDGSLRPGARLLYAVLLHLAGDSGDCSPTGKELLSLAGIASHSTLESYVRELVSSGWLEKRTARRRKLVYVLHHPYLEERKQELARVRRRLETYPHKGEALMKEWLSVIVDSRDFANNVRPGYLTNPLTGELMEYDRIYMGKVAFEFNGPQHYGPTPRYPDPQVAKDQQARDAMKTGISLQHGVHLVIVTAEDLSLERMQQKVGNLLPRRDVDPEDPVVAYLTEASAEYRGKVLRHRYRPQA